MAETKSEQILVETRNLRDLNIPLTRTSRLRYTSLSVSDRVIALGSNTGGIYIFSKTDCKLLQVAFAEKETAAVNQLVISPNEKFVAFTVSTGKVHVIDLKLDTRAKSETLRSVTDLGGAIVMCLKWCVTSSKLFIGDDMGKVTMVPVHTSKAKNLFSIPMEVIMKLDSAIVQIDKAEDKLLVSTLTRCYLCDTAKHQYTQIGKKPRDGHYGACFLSQGSTTSMIYCARPGSRIWEVDIEGGVLNTHQFKQLLAVHPLSLLDINRKFTPPDEETVYAGQSVNFPKLKIISGRYLLTWNTTTIYILDPVNVRLILWTNHFNGITDISCVKNELYVYLQTMQVHCLSLMSVSKAIALCMGDAKLETVARLCCFYGNILHRKHLRRHLGVADLYKIYDELVRNEMHELSTNVLSCVKDIENKVAMESDTDTSDSNRSRSSSILSASTEIQTSGTDGLPSVSSSKEETDGQSVKDRKENVVESSRVDTSAIIDGNNQLDKNVVQIDSHGDMKLRGDSAGKLASDSDLVPVQTLHNDTTIRDTGGNWDTDTVIGLGQNNVNPTHNVNNNLISKQSDKDVVVNEVIKDGVLLDSKLNGKGGVEDNCDLPGGERGEPDGNCYGDEYDESNVATEKAGNQVTVHLETTVKDPNDNSIVEIAFEPSLHIIKGSGKDNEIENESGAVNNDSDEDTSSGLQVQVPWTSRSPSPLSMTDSLKDNPNGLIEDDDAFIVDTRKGLGARRPSLTSLSSFDSADVTIDQLSADPGEKIAIQIKRRTSTKKKKKRKSSSDVKGSPSSLHSFRSMIEESTGAPVEVTEDTDNVLQSIEGTDTIDGGWKNSGIEITASPPEPVDDLDKSGDFLQSSEFGVSGEFQRSSDWGMSGEFHQKSTERSKEDMTQRSSDWGMSGEFHQKSTEKSKEDMTGSPSSAPKAALMKFKDKMQTQVTTKTKKLIQNIKDKNLLTKAKEIAETFSQGSEATMAAGGYFLTDPVDSFEESSGMKTSGSNGRTYIDGNLEGPSEALAPLIDMSDLQASTDRVRASLDDAETLNDLDMLYKLLEDWVIVLNKTFHNFHVKKYAPIAVNSAFTSENVGPVEKMAKSWTSDKVEQSDLADEPKDNEKGQTAEQDSCLNRHGDCSGAELAASNFEKILADPDFCYLSDPLGLPLDALKAVSQLVQACFEIGCHGNILTYQKLEVQTGRHCDSNTNRSNEEIDSSENNTSHSADTNETKGDHIVDTLNLDTSSGFENIRIPISKEPNKVDSDTTIPKLSESENMDCSTDSSINARNPISEKPNEIKRFSKPRVDLNTGNINGSYSTGIPISDSEKPDELEKDSKVEHTELQEEKQQSTSDTDTLKTAVDRVGDTPRSADCDTRGLVHSRTPMNFYIRLYYPYLQLHRIQKENLNYPEWSALVTCLQGCALDEGERLGVKDDGVLSHLLESRNQKNGSLTVLGHIARLFSTKEPGVVESAVRCYPHVQPVDVLYLCHYHQNPIQTTFKQYMFRMLEHLTTIHKPDVEKCLFSHTDVRRTWLDMLLDEDCMSENFKDADGNPRAMSNKLIRKNQHLVEQVLSKLGDYQPTGLPDLLLLFSKHGYWNGKLQVLRHLGHTDDHCKTILYLRDIELLSDSHPLGYLPRDMKEWENLLSTFNGLPIAGNQDLQSCDWSSLITWNSLAILLVRTVGPELALALLEDCSLEEGDLNAEFYQTCILSSMVHKHKRSILYTMLEKVDMYLWSQRPPVVMPQVHYLLVNEKKLISELTSELTNQMEETVQSLSNLLKGDKSDEHRPFAEDPDSQWGVNTKFNLHCGCCNIPLKEAVSHTEPWVLLFRCGHGFHKQCLPDRQCVLCDEEDSD